MGADNDYLEGYNIGAPEIFARMVVVHLGGYMREGVSYLSRSGNDGAVNIQSLNCEIIPSSIENREEICSICLENMGSSTEPIIRLPCNHIFHKGCLTPWVEKQLSCPNCKSTACRPANMVIQRENWLLSSAFGIHLIRLVPILVPTMITGIAVLLGHGGAHLEVAFFVFCSLIPLFIWVSFMSSLVQS